MTTTLLLMAEWLENLEAEGIDVVNDRARQTILDMGEGCWLGFINGGFGREDKPIMWQWSGEMVYNFGASFVVPAYDEKLVELIEDYRKPCEGGFSVSKKWPKIQAVSDRIHELGGKDLIWL